MGKKDSRELFEDIKSIIEEFAPCMDDFLYVYDINNDSYYITEKALDRFDIPTNFFHDVVKMHGRIVHPDDIDLIMDDLNRVISGERDFHDLVYRWMGKDGSPVWINCQGKLIERPESGIKFLIGCINEIGLKQWADNVSGLLGERSFMMELDSCGEKLPDGYILRIGIDDFKIINEKLGSTYGDFVIHSVADCINRCKKPWQTAYRLVADEFAILDLNGGTKEEAENIYNEIRTKVDHFLENAGYKAVFTISAGILLTQDIKENEYDSMMKLSRYTLSEAKYRGKNQIYVYCKEDYEKFLHRRKLLSALRVSVANHFEGFELYFQPIVDVRTNKLFAAESLVRFWQNETTMVSPGEFIPILEESGLIIPVGKWIIQTAVKTCREWREIIPDFCVTINLSYIQLQKSPIFDTVINTIQEMGMQSSGIIVEMTESGYVENSPAMRSVWRKFKENGVSIAIDDFGTGYSNLVNIGEMMPHLVKVDRNFTVRALKNDYENDLLEHIINMVHNLGIKVVVEGVETEEECNRIKKLGPDYIQGYFYSKPCPAQEFKEKFIVDKDAQ